MSIPVPCSRFAKSTIFEWNFVIMWGWALEKKAAIRLDNSC